MKTTSIHIEGQIISPEIFDRLESNDISGQLPQNYGFDKGKRIKDEIALAWADAKDQWNIFKRRIEKLSDEESGTAETRKYWIIPLLETLGYNLAISRAEEVNGNSFAISHRAQNLEGFPVHIVGVNDSLDRRRETSGPRLSPHALVQEYLNITEHLYAIVTNGYQLRILRDSGKLIRLTYMEFDLFQIMEDDLYAEFSIMYRIIHASRMPQKFGEGDSSVIEQYHQLSLEAGARIRDGLSKAVEKSIVSVANGFLKHSTNEKLRIKIKSGELSNEQFYQFLLRFIYRLLFLMVLEERNIVYPGKRDENQEYLHDIYYNYYSITRIRKLSENIFFFDEKLEDLWISLRNTFDIFGDERLAAKLGIYPLNGELFGLDSLGILIESNLDNHTLLECIRNLSLFENPETKSIIHVNYAALNVEEFGSVYEGLLEKSPVVTDNGSEFNFNFVKGTERSSSGSHYTPEELVQPLIKHSLDYIIEEKLKTGDKELKEKNLLSIKVCDVACGSGHILLSAARRIAVELARVRTGEDQPSPEPYRHAMRDVINHCIYGVDKNPLAVELCKVALWLESYNSGMPLSFLDHRIKCGDSIVGLARIEELKSGITTEAFNTMPGDEKDIAASFRKQNKIQTQTRAQINLSDTSEIIENLNLLSVKFKQFDLLPDTSINEVKKKQEEYNVLKGTDWMRLKELADIQIAQFFIPKTNTTKEFVTTDAEYFRIFAGQKRDVNIRKVSTAMAISAERKFFHWFLEFPDVMQAGGFDCILGNPPYLGGKKISGSNGLNYLNFVNTEYHGISGQADLVTYFLRRIFSLIIVKGSFSLITTNSISDGDTRQGGLEIILNQDGIINFALKNIKWSGAANLFVSLLSVHKGAFKGEITMNNQKINYISSFLTGVSEVEPYRLSQSSHLMFRGVDFGCDGFMLNNKQRSQLCEKDSSNCEVIFPLLNGSLLNSNYRQDTDRYIINFFNWPLQRTKKSEWDALSTSEKEKFISLGNVAPDYSEKVATDYPDCLNILSGKVKPERTRWKKDRMNNDIIGEYALRKPLPQKWWIYAEKRPGLNLKLKNKMHCIVTAFSAKHMMFSRIESNFIFSNAINILVDDKYFNLAILQSNIHESWVWKFASKLKNDLRYTPSDCFDTFPFPQNILKRAEVEIEKFGEKYHEFRKQLMIDLQLGLTKTYNLFHDRDCTSNNLEKVKDIREFKQANMQIELKEAIKRIGKLRELHKNMDDYVLNAYDWADINLSHDFYELDYLPENDRIRYTISPESRKEILKRLLALNHQIHEAEVKAGLWEKGESKKKYKSLIVKDQGKLFGN